MFFVSRACVFVLCASVFVCSHAAVITRSNFCSLSFRVCPHVSVCAQEKQVSLSCMPVILRMPLRAPQSFTWHQSESSGIVISLPTACCWLKPAVCTLLLCPFFLRLSPPCSRLPPCPLLARPPSSTTTTTTRTHPPYHLLHPSIPESHHSVVSPLPAAKKGPILSSAESYKLPPFFFSLLLLCFFVLPLCCTSLSYVDPLLCFPPAGLTEALLMFLIIFSSQSTLTLIHMNLKVERKESRKKIPSNKPVCVFVCLSVRESMFQHVDTCAY